MTQLIAVHGCTYRRAQQEELSNLWQRELLGPTSLADNCLISHSDFSCISFTDLLLSRETTSKTRRDIYRNEGLTYAARQVRRYISDPACRRAVHDRVTGRIGSVKAVMVAHSLGSVAAYEALCSLPAHNVYTLITLGSPLGLRRMFFNRLQSPTIAGRHSWPAPLAQWINISFTRDPIAFVKRLSPMFGDGQQITDIILPGRSNSHALQSYLSTPETRSLVAGALYSMRKCGNGK